MASTASEINTEDEPVESPSLNAEESIPPTDDDSPRSSHVEETNVPRVEDLLKKLGGYSKFQLWVTFLIILPEIPGAMITMSPILTTIAENSSVTNSTSPTLAEEWGLVERAWTLDLLISVQMVGGMFGALISAHCADRLGRRSTFFSLCSLMGFSGIASALAHSAAHYGVLRFMAGFAVGGMYVVYLNYLMEFLTPAYRTICGCVSLWPLGEMLLALIANFTTNWRQLTLYTAIPALIILLGYPWIPESPRWLLCRGRTAEAESVFRKMAKWNGKEPLTKEEVNEVQAYILLEEKSGSKASLWRMVEKGHRGQLAGLIWSWFSVSLLYYSLSFNTKHLSADNRVLNVFYLGVSDLPGCFSAILFNNWLGRKRSLCGFLSVAAIMLIGLLVIEEGWIGGKQPSVLTLVSLVARYVVSASWATLSCFTAESFPTISRARAMGLCSFSGYVAGIIAPFLIFAGTEWRGFSYAIFACLSTITAVVSFLLRETLGQPLQDSPTPKPTVAEPPTIQNENSC